MLPDDNLLVSLQFCPIYQVTSRTTQFLFPPLNKFSFHFTDMFGPGSPTVPAPSGAFSFFGGSDDTRQDSAGPNSPAGFSFSFGGGTDSPSGSSSSAQPFSLF